MDCGPYSYYFFPLLYRFIDLSILPDVQNMSSMSNATNLNKFNNHFCNKDNFRLNLYDGIGEYLFSSFSIKKDIAVVYFSVILLLFCKKVYKFEEIFFISVIECF